MVTWRAARRVAPALPGPVDCPAAGGYIGPEVRGGRMHEAAVVTPVRSGPQVGKSCENLL